MNILITGSLGHIGSFFLKKISYNPKINKIYIIDNNFEKINVLFNLKLKNKIFFRLANLVSKDTLKPIKNINTVIHFASLTNAEESVENKKLIIRNNFGSFLNVVNYCKKNKCNLIHISSTSVYGSRTKIVDEECKELRPQSPYAEIKLKEEKYLKKNRGKIKFVTLRFATIVGASDGMKFHTAVNKFCYNAIINKPITVWKTAMNQYRPYLSINDACKAIFFVLKKNLFDKSIYNIATTNLTVKQILNKIKKIKKNIKIKNTNSKIMNRLSYRILSKKIKDKGLKLGKNIDRDINNIFKIFKFIETY